MIKYLGKSFPLRSILTEEFGEVSISTEELNDLLMNESDYTCDEARIIDEQIFFYIPKDFIGKSDTQIEKFILSNI